MYVNDILLASENEQDCKIDTVALLTYLAEQGHKVNKNKLQLWKKMVKYLGFNISFEGRHLDGNRKTAILQAPKPQTKKQMMSFLGMTNFCRAWITNYAEVTHPLQMLIYDKPMAANDTITWTAEGEHVFAQ